MRRRVRLRKRAILSQEQLPAEDLCEVLGCRWPRHDADHRPVGHLGVGFVRVMKRRTRLHLRKDADIAHVAGFFNGS